MTRLKMPEFHMPYEARLNPHVNAVRTENRRWSQEVGLVGCAADLERYDAGDYPLFTSYIYPDAPLHELTVATDWNVWEFLLDDQFGDTYQAVGDLDRSTEIVAGLRNFLPVDTGARLPTPGNIVERSLADLWLRTAPSVSTTYRARLFANIMRFAEGYLWEIANHKYDRTPDLIDFTEMRRDASGAQPSADLVEYALGIEIPAYLHATRPIRVLHQTMDDVIGFTNDIFSYDREVMSRQERHNAVYLYQHHLQVGAQRAAELVNDTITSRIGLFEHTLRTDLPTLLDGSCITSQGREIVMRWVEGIKSWGAGNLAWHWETRRYEAIELWRPRSTDSGSVPARAW